MTALPSEIFARRMREERTRAGLAQAEIARRITSRLGVTIDGSAVTRIEKRERVVRLDEAVAIAEVLGVPITQLLSDTDPTAERIGELDEELAQHRWRADQSQRELEQARESIAAVEREIAALKAQKHSLSADKA